MEKYLSQTPSPGVAEASTVATGGIRLETRRTAKDRRAFGAGAARGREPGEPPAAPARARASRRRRKSARLVVLMELVRAAPEPASRPDWRPSAPCLRHA